MAIIKIKRAYEAEAKADGFRVMVDRLWPRGIKKEALHIDSWLKEIAPSTALRKWFDHDPKKWPGFKRKYNAELNDSPAAKHMIELTKKHKTVTLVYSAKDEQHNNAIVIKEFLENNN
jgi:uncharacterized protein YeaO (DUF488 family)